MGTAQNRPAHSVAVLVACLIIGCGPAEPTTDVVKTIEDTTAVRTPAAQDGPVVIHTDDGGRMEGLYAAGKRTGPWTAYFQNGAVRSRANYAEGVEEGPTEVFHENGMPYYSGQYVGGMPVGEWVFYSDKGSELKRVRYDSTGVVVK